jgi:hypothetical protein
LYSLTNSLGVPEKLAALRSKSHLYYHPRSSAYFGGFSPDLFICDCADEETGSFTNTGKGFAASAALGDHPMALRQQRGWRVAEIVAWIV